MTQLQRERYARHIALEGVGEAGQEKLLRARVLIIGAGGLGSPVSIYLTAAGVGTIGIADVDDVDLTNLQRQILHRTADIGRAKVASAKDTLEAQNPDVCIKTYPVRVTQENIVELIDGYDFVVDATDNFATKFLINDACVAMKKPFVHGGIIGFQGQLLTYVPGKGACYRCVFQDVPPEGAVQTCKEVGIFGTMCGVIGSLQATEVIKYFTGVGELLTGTLLTYDARTMTFRRVPLP
ncbi:MAG: HesA/MoeB/ThiF family protein [Ruminococcus sp.]|nr:HesA/MoeB/ThiF family protein [Ruminococcus sp.]